MYVITFYSFKGGVGRTMALVNVAAELARRGRTVLVVDFDLEAPGLETYKLLGPPKPHPGIVEYVTEFRRTCAVPNLLDYIYETKPIGKKGGRLWVMPAGRRDRAYRNALAELDWQRLYKEEDGFLLFEDTKKGWEEELKPDYVLIDSRTGDTDVLGICTRQLPDAVVLMFTPNEQNLAGLENVCRDIGREKTEGLKKEIRLHFVASNVPDLDDYEGILRRQIHAFKERLRFKELSGVIRRYENLNLLNQSVFTLDRPRTRLAQSYRRLLRTLLKDNFADRQGAMIFLEDYAKLDPASRPPDKYLTPQEWATRFPDRVDPTTDRYMTCWIYDEPREEIAKHFSDDVEVLDKLADYCWLKEDYGNAICLLDRILELERGFRDARFRRALCKINEVEMIDASADLLACLTQADEDSTFTRRCLSKLREIAPHRLSEAAEVLSASGFPGLQRRELAEFLCDSEAGLPAAARLLREFFASLDERARENQKQSDELLNLLLRARCWKEAIQLLETSGSQDLKASQLFRLALAHWGEGGEMPDALCRLALERSNGPLNREEHSWLRWRLGNRAEAMRLLNEEEEYVRGGRVIRQRRLQLSSSGPIFSLWRMWNISVEQYLDDCRLVRRMFEGEPLRPAFLGPPPPTTK